MNIVKNAGLIPAIGLTFMVAVSAGVFKGPNFKVEVFNQVKTFMKEQPNELKDAFQKAFSNFSIIGYSARQQKDEHGYYRRQKVGKYTIGFDRPVEYFTPDERSVFQIKKGDDPHLMIGYIVDYKHNSIGIQCIAPMDKFLKICPKYEPVRRVIPPRNRLLRKARF